MLRHRLSSVVVLALLSGLLPLFVLGEPAYGAGELPEGFDQTRLVGGLASPTAMEFAPDGRLFVAEKGGTLRVVTVDGDLLPDPFVDISDKVDARGERGLLGVAFDPNFETGEPYVYAYYTQKATGANPPRNLVVRFTANGDEAANGSETAIFELPGLGEFNHNGGAIHFGEDDELYVAVGDNRRDKLAQSLDSLFGKMLRINKDGSIPNDNPFYEKTSGKNRAIWARGLRNPFTFAVQPGTGRIHINDVGASAWEEINKGKAGANYGWPRYEGPENKGKFESPIFAYRHGSSETTGQAITGGAFYNPGTMSFPASYEGDYFFADIASGWIRKYDPATDKATAFKRSSNESPVDLKVSEDGDLYFLARGGGSVEKISYAP
jgi:glucose/arabinose dehydrogenase